MTLIFFVGQLNYIIIKFFNKKFIFKYHIVKDIRSQSLYLYDSVSCFK
jgi:hypothetical protein